METNEAFEMLRRMQEPEAWEPQISEKAFDALEMAIDALALTRWIPVTERLPEKGQKCLVSDNGCIAIDVFLGRGGVCNWQSYVWDYEAWMPLPKPYKEEKKK